MLLRTGWWPKRHELGIGNKVFEQGHDELVFMASWLRGCVNFQTKETQRPSFCTQLLKGGGASFVSVDNKF